ncbi:MAG: hypothetical protein M1813_002052 [Trichoglossum hirsutum]|nr:MAG: hypothetical protein M1813_002052 [Trichoglossum hirsutum]
MLDQPKTLGDPTLAIADFERAMVALFLPVKTNQSQLADSDFDAIGRLLYQVGKQEWSHRPRTYAVLRMIDRIDLLDTFILDGLKDIAFPYVDSRLPTSLNPTAKARFLQAQKLVLTKASDLEKSDGRHRHLDQDADTHFHILKILGRGGFGEVDHVRSKLSLEEYARKRMYRKKVFSRDREAIKMFENELTNLKRLSHHHLVKFIGSYTDPKFVGLLMSPVADCDLKVFLGRDPFPKDDLYLLRGFFGCLCSAVLYLHNSKCRHKDLKPGNILVYISKVLITDFGTARDWSDQSRSTTIGRSNAFTFGYAAPEVVEQEPRSSSADIWSLGCIYLDMATVLRGESMASKDRFFSENGTGGANPRNNPEALDLWLARLKSETDERPLEWIKQMIRKPRNERVTAAGLMDQIHSYEDEHVYYNSCCNGDEESEDDTSYEGSVFEGDANATKDSVESRADDNAADTVVPTSGEEPLEVSIPRRAVPLESLNSENQENNKTAFQHPEDVDAKDNRDRWMELHQATSSRPEGPSRSTELPGSRDQPFPLHYAAASGNFTAVKELVEQGWDLDLNDEYGSTPLDAAIRKSDNGSVVGLLLTRGARACSESTKDQVRSLVENGLVSLRASRMHEVGEWLGMNGIQYRRATPVDPKDSRPTEKPRVREQPFPLHYAAESGNFTAVKELVEQGWDLDLIDEYGSTPLDAAIRKSDNGSVVGLLLTRGARACSKSTKDQVRSLVENGLISLRVSRMREVNEWLGINRVQDQRATSIDPKNSQSTERLKVREHPFPLHYAAASGNFEVVKELLERGWDMDLTNEDGHTPLDSATWTPGNEPIIGLLLTRGARACSKVTKDRVRSLVASGLVSVRASRMREVNKWLQYDFSRPKPLYHAPKKGSTSSSMWKYFKEKIKRV